MNFKKTLFALTAAAALAFAGCGGDDAGAPANSGGGAAGSENANATPDPNVPRQGAPLPDAAYKAQLSLVEPLTKLKAGQKQAIKIKVKNVSGVKWFVRGTGEGNKYVVAAADSWLDAGGELLTNMDDRYGLPDDLEPGQETEVPLHVTAPKEPGEYILELDLVQEGVNWFKDKGSQTFRTKVRVER